MLTLDESEAPSRFAEVIRHLDGGETVIPAPSAVTTPRGEIPAETTLALEQLRTRRATLPTLGDISIRDLIYEGCSSKSSARRGSARC